MFASLNLLTAMPTPPIDAGGDARTDGDSDFSALLETHVPFAELCEMPGPIPVVSNIGSGDLLPEDGKNLPLTPVLADSPVAESEDSGAGSTALPEKLLATDIELDLQVEYPVTDLPAESLTPVTLLPQDGSDIPKPAPGTPVPGAITATPSADEKPLPPVEQLRPVRQWVESTDWIATNDETGPIIAKAMNANHYKATRVIESPTAVIPVADGESALQDIPVLAPAVRAGSTLDTVRQADTRVPGVKAPVALPSVATAPAHIAASLSQFSAGAELANDDTLSTLIATPVRDNAWGDKLGERVMMLAGTQIKTADIRLTPADLGPLRIQLSIDDNVTNVTFHAQHAVTHEAIEQALPRLREMLAESGLSLGQASVSDRGASDDQSGNGASNPAANHLGVGESSDPLVDSDTPPRRKSVSLDGLIDTFA